MTDTEKAWSEGFAVGFDVAKELTSITQTLGDIDGKRLLELRDQADNVEELRTLFLEDIVRRAVENMRT